MKFSENYLQCYAVLDVACFKHDLITLEKLAEVVWQWYKALDPGGFESPNSEIQTQISNWNFSGFPLKWEGFNGGKNWRAKCDSNELRSLLFIAKKNDICTLQNLSKIGNVNGTSAWACTGPWCNALRSKMIPIEVWIKLEWQGNVNWSLYIWFFPIMQPC